LPYMLILLDEAFALNTNTNKQKQFLPWNSKKNPVSLNNQCHTNDLNFSDKMGGVYISIQLFALN